MKNRSGSKEMNAMTVNILNKIKYLFDQARARKAPAFLSETSMHWKVENIWTGKGMTTTLKLHAVQKLLKKPQNFGN